MDLFTKKVSFSLGALRGQCRIASYPVAPHRPQLAELSHRVPQDYSVGVLHSQKGHLRLFRQILFRYHGLSTQRGLGKISDDQNSVKLEKAVICISPLT